MGDRFAHQGKGAASARASAPPNLARMSFRSGTNPTASTPSSARNRRQFAARRPDDAVKALGWKKSYHVDADHIRLETVDRFIAPSDFFTIDVADSISGKPADAMPSLKTLLLTRHAELIGKVVIPHIDQPFSTTREYVERVAGKFLLAVQDAGENLPPHRQDQGQEANFITEVSMDENRQPADAAGTAHHPCGARG